jgi:hypothetical protein
MFWFTHVRKKQGCISTPLIHEGRIVEELDGIDVGAIYRISEVYPAIDPS